MKKISDADFDTEWADEEGGVVDYPDLTNKPSINGNTLIGNKTGAELGLTELVELTQAEYDALESIDPNKAYFITDADPEALGTAAYKDYTDRVRPGDTGLVMSHVVYSAINSALSSIYTPRGNIDCADLTSSLLVDANVGNVYETNDSGTTTALFMQGAGKTINAGDNVGVIRAGADTILFNLMGNAFDLTDYQKKDLTTAAEGQTTVEGAIGALATNKQEKTLTTPVESQSTVEGALGHLSSAKQPKTLSAAVEGETTVENALSALSDNKQAKTLSAAVEGQNTVEGALGALSTNKTTQAEVNDIIVNVLGAKNLFDGSINTTTAKGVTFTQNADGTISVTGSNTQGSSLGVFANRIQKLKAGSYILNGCPSPTSGGLHIQLSDNNAGILIAEVYDGNEVSFTLNADTNCKMMYWASGDLSITGTLIIKPMIRLASDPDNTYAPYTMTNKQITDAMPLNVGVNNKLIPSLSRIITVAESTANPDILNTLAGGNVKFAWGAIKLQNGAPQTIDNEVYVISYAETNISQVGDTAVIAQIAIARSGSGYNSRIYKRFYCYHGGTYKWSPWDIMISASDLSYSTSETKTGATWIDGKPIYRKAFHYTGVAASGASALIGNITGFADIITFKGTFRNNNDNNCFPIGYTYSNFGPTVAQNMPFIVRYDGNIYANPYGFDITNINIIVEYTKTTD